MGNLISGQGQQKLESTVFGMSDRKVGKFLYINNASVDDQKMLLLPPLDQIGLAEKNSLKGLQEFIELRE
jgi:hypothetical protein